MSADSLFLRQATDADAEHLQGWFADANQLFYWGGPGLNMDVSRSEFRLQIKLYELNSFSLVDGEHLLGFGQFYVRLGRHHLGRLAISPQFRGKGLSKVLVTSLCELAPKMQSAKGYSLFVLPDNITALSLYQQLGFFIAEYPEAIPGGLDQCLYMVKD